MTTDAAALDIDAVKDLIKANIEEFAPLLEEFAGASSPARQEALEDKYGRSIHVTDKVTTPAGETGMVIRLDKNSKRVLIRLDHPTDPDKPTRMLMAHRVEVKRGRPRTKTRDRDLAVAV